jgi:hypothetical protein
VICASKVSCKLAEEAAIAANVTLLHWFDAHGRDVPFELVEDILTRARRVQQRLRLPSRVGVYFVLALALFPGPGYALVWDKLIAALPRHLGLSPLARVLGELRRRLSPAPFQELFPTSPQVSPSLETSRTLWRTCPGLGVSCSLSS